MKRKRIVFPEPNVAELVESDIDSPKENEVQVRLAVSTVSSGTERANITGDPNVNMGGPPAPWPRILGYSSAGVVVEVGENVTDFKIGDRVALSWSTHSELLNIDCKNVYKLPDSISFNDGALLHIGTFPLAAIRKCRLEIGEPAIIMGMGILGLVAIQLLKAAGAVPVIAVDPIPEKREKALEVGADYVFDPYDADFAKKVREMTNGGAKVGIEVTGIGAGLDGILDCMAQFGRVALLGCTRNKNFTIDYYKKVHSPGISLIGAHTMARPHFESSNGYWTQTDDIHALIKLIGMGRIRLSSLVDEIHRPDEARQVYDRLVSEKSFPVVQFDWSNIS